MFHLALLLTTAAAGKLQDGWHGLVYGDAAVVDAAPAADCDRDPEFAVRWRCRETIGTVPVVVAYMVDEGVFMSVAIKADGFSTCSTLFDTLVAGWGAFDAKQYATGPLADGYWNLPRAETETVASWSYNRYSGACTATTVNLGLYAIVKERRALKAAAGAKDL